MTDQPTVLAFESRSPHLDERAWLAPTATVIGDVTVAADAGVFYGAVLRADMEEISIGPGTNVQDNAVVHADPGFPARIGAGVSIGHGAVLHGCTVGDDCLIGMNATVLNGAVIGAGSLIAAGALILEGTIIPPRSLVAGIPGKVRRELTDEESAGVRSNASTYVDLAWRHREETSAVAHEGV